LVVVSVNVAQQVLRAAHVAVSEPPAPAAPIEAQLSAASLRHFENTQFSRPVTSHVAICALQAPSTQLSNDGHMEADAGGIVVRPVQPPVPNGAPPRPTVPATPVVPARLVVPPKLAKVPPLLKLVPPLLELVPPWPELVPPVLEVVPAPLPLPPVLLEPPQATSAAQATTALAILHLVTFMSRPLG
jgi:hypothetical protein